MHYTPGQTRWFLQAIEAQDRLARHDRICDQRAGESVDAKQLAAYLKELRK